MKRTGLIIAMLVVFCAAALAQARPYDHVVVGNNVLVRTEPNLGSKAVAQVSIGDWAYVTEKSDGWYDLRNGAMVRGAGYRWFKIQCRRGPSGWIFGKYLAKTRTHGYRRGVYAAVGGESMDFRTASVRYHDPHSDEASFEAIYPYFQDQSDNYHLLYRHGKPFFLRQDVGQSPTIKAVYHCYAKPGSLLLSVDFRHYQRHEFVYFYFSDATGELRHADEVRLPQALESEIPTRPPAADAIVVGERVRIRSQPNLQSKVLNHLSAGDWVDIERETDHVWHVENGEMKHNKGYHWYKIAHKGPTGWSYGRYIAKIIPEEKQWSRTLENVPTDGQNLYFSVARTDYYDEDKVPNSKSHVFPFFYGDEGEIMMVEKDGKSPHYDENVFGELFYYHEAFSLPNEREANVMVHGMQTGMEEFQDCFFFFLVKDGKAKYVKKVCSGYMH